MAENETRKSRGWMWVLVAILVAVGLFFWIRSMTHKPVVVRSATAAFGDIVSTVPTNGKVEPVRDFQALAPSPGVVRKLYVSVDQPVHAGQLLVTMDDYENRNRLAAAVAQVHQTEDLLHNMEKGGTNDELLSENADIKTAQLQVQAGQSTLDKLTAMQAHGDASPNEVAEARQKLADSQTRLNMLLARRTQRYSAEDLQAQRSQVHQAHASVAAAAQALNTVDIHAPFSGTVYSLPVNQFDFVKFGDDLLNIADLNHLQVRAYFDEPEIGKLAVGQTVKITWDARPNDSWHGHITQAPTTVITYGARNVGECLISVDDPHNNLLPNTNVTVTVTTMHRDNVLSIPREGLRTDGAQNYVYRIVGGKLSRTPVGVGVVSLTRVEITSGLKQGDVVALNALSEADLSNGLEVQTKP